MGDQVRASGFLHDGSVDTLFRFHNAQVFNNGFAQATNTNCGTTSRNVCRRNVEQFMFAFDSDLAPIVGQQVTATPSTFSTTNVINRINLLIARDEAGDCDLVVKGNLSGVARGWVYDDANNQFRSDRSNESLIAPDTLRTQAGTAGQERTYMCVPPGSGIRIGIDRDGDGFPDRTELDAGSDPANPASVPSGCG
jgi:hypothetical protein